MQQLTLDDVSPSLGEEGSAGAGHVPALPDFDPARAARRTDPLTSHLAAQSVAGDVTERQAAVLAVHAAHPAGLTDDEVWERLPSWLLGSVSKRRGELAEGGLLEVVAERRLTRRNRSANVYRLTSLGAAVHVRLEFLG